VDAVQPSATDRGQQARQACQDHPVGGAQDQQFVVQDRDRRVPGGC
jgi:hypothetical protein